MATNAIDNDAGTAWSFGSGSNWIYLDLGVNKLVNRVTLDWTATASRAWSIQYAVDGASDLSANSADWTTVYAESAGTHVSGGTAAGVADITGLSFVGRFVRMLSWVPNESSSPTAGLKQMSVYGSADTSCPTTDTTGCGTTSTALAATYQVEDETVTCDTRTGTTTGSGYTACSTALRAATSNSSGTWRALANGESLAFGSVDGGANGGAAILKVRQSPRTNSSSTQVPITAVYVKYSDTNTEQLYGVVSATPNGTSTITFADSQATQIYLHPGTTNTIELRDFASGVEPYVDYISVSPLNEVSKTCQGSPFTVSTFNLSTLVPSGAFDAGIGFTSPDRREIKSTGGSTLSRNVGSAYYLYPTTTLSFEMAVANMAVLTSVKLRLAAVSTSSNVLFLGVWDGASWTDKRISDYGGLITSTIADRVIPLSEYGIALSSISKLRLSANLTSTSFYFQIDEITVQ
jgi:hypothetical protein